MTRIVIVLLALILSAPALAGCGESGAEPQVATQAPTTATTEPPAATTVPPPSTNTSAPTRTVTLYFADSEAQQLIEEARPTTATGSDLRAALVELANGPAQGSGRQPALPQGSAIVGTNVQGGEALVNLSAEFTQGYPSGGAAAEFAVLAPLVYTATAVAGVERVRITVDGQTPAPAGSQFDWSTAFTRADFPDVVAAP